MKSTILQELQWRGYIAQCTHEELDDCLAKEASTLYAGFDPTANSLHVGSLVPLMAMAFFRRHGHQPIGVVGGATGMIGDPSFKSEERTLLTQEEVQNNLEGIQSQMETILERSLVLHPETLPAVERKTDSSVTLLNNFSWFQEWSFIDFLRDVGKYFSVNNMIKKDSVQTRLEDRDQGISFTEFSYMLLQSFDFYHLYQNHNCVLQIGATDQWGNITGGVELIRKKTGKTAYGLTFPLLMTNDGRKMGKTEKGAVWLSADKTSPFQFYQYFVQQADEEVSKLLKLFTFLPKEQIESLCQEITDGKNKGEVQKVLAYEICCLVHGEKEAQKAIQASQMLFGEEIVDLCDKDLLSIFADVPSSEHSFSLLQELGTPIIDLLVESGLQASKGAARRMLEQGGIYINNQRITEKEMNVTTKNLASESMLVLRSGKKNYHVLKFLP